MYGEWRKTGKKLENSQTCSDFPQHVFLAMRLSARLCRGSDVFRDLSGAVDTAQHHISQKEDRGMSRFEHFRFALW
jgi:hypothetical protein